MKKKNNFDKTYWENRYINHQIGWDIGFPSTPLKTYIDQLKDKTIRILIPGAGNGYEAQYLWEQGFRNTFVVDIAKNPIDHLKQRIPNFPSAQCIHKDFFDLEMKFDLILEQTFFCALNPDLRKDYVTKMHQLLHKKGKIVGLFFDFPLTETGPPFGGNNELYQDLFSKLFDIKILEKSINLIKERQGKELFFIFDKK